MELFYRHLALFQYKIKPVCAVYSFSLGRVISTLEFQEIIDHVISLDSFSAKKKNIYTLQST